MNYLILTKNIKKQLSINNLIINKIQLFQLIFLQFISFYSPLKLAFIKKNEIYCGIETTKAFHTYYLKSYLQ